MKVCAAGAAGAAATGLAGVPGWGASSSAKSASVLFQLDFLPLGRFAPFYYGVASGIYKRHGLNVRLATSSGSGPALQQLVAGNAQWLSNDLAQMLRLMGRVARPRMRSYAAYFAKASQTIFFFRGGPIKTPKDLEGKTIATSAGSNEYLLFPLFAKANGIDASKVRWKVVDASAKTGLLLQGTVDATSTTLFGLAGLEAGAKPGQKIGYFMYGDYGVHLQGASLITRDDFAHAHPEAVKPFIRASVEAIAASFKDPGAAVSAMARMVPSLNTRVALAEMKLLPSIVLGPAQKEHGIGYQDPAVVRATYESVITVLHQPISLPYTDFFTNAALA